MPTPIRRIVTGKDANGKAIVMIDALVPITHNRAETGIAMSQLWMTDAMPANQRYDFDAATVKTGVPPPQNGTIFRVVEFAPEKDIPADFATHRAFVEKMGLFPEGPQRDNPRHPAMHKTNTVDYAIVIEGEIDMLLDDSEIHLKAGDVLVQQGTNHAWANRGDKPCKVCFVLVDASS
jgi:quercetin dioxygenase-like cupin family protein